MATRRMAALAAVIGLASGCGAGVRGVRIPTVPVDAPAEAARLEAQVEVGAVDLDGLVRLAQAHASAGEPSLALPYVLRALAMAPGHEGALVVAARVAALAGDPDTAIARYEQAAAAAPAVRQRVAGEWARVLLGQARQRLDAGRPLEALDTLDRVTAELPSALASTRSERAGLALAAAEALIRRGSAVEAARAVASARQAGAPPDALRFADARARWLSGEDEAAWRAFEAWVGEASDGGWSRVGAFLTAREAPDAALDAWKRAVEAGDDVPREAWEGLADAALATDRPDAAARAFQSLAGGAADPVQRARWLVEGAGRLRAAGHASTAAPLYAAATDSAPASWPAVEAHGRFLVQVGDGGGLRELLDRYEAAAGGGLEAALGAARLLAFADAHGEAADRLEALAARAGGPPEALLEAARVLGRGGPVAGRRDRLLARWLAATGATPAARVAAARVRLEAGDRKGALALAREAVAAAPDDLAAALTLADVWRALGRSGDERAALAAGLKRQVDMPEAALGLRVGERYLAHGDAAQAVVWLTQAARAADPAVARRAHEGLWRAHLGRRPPADRVATEHMRAWLALAPAADRHEALSVLLEQTVGVRALAGLRLEVLEELARARPDDPTLPDAIGRLHLDAREFGAAREAWLRHLAVLDDPGGAALRHGRAFLEKGRSDEALIFLSRVDPARITSPRLHRSLGDLHARRGDTARAEVHDRLFLEAASRGEQRHELRLFARGLLRRRQDVLAADAWRLLLDRDEADREAMLGLGTAVLRIEGVEAARPWLDRFVEETPPSQRRQAFQKAGAVFEAAGHLGDAARMYGRWLAEERPGWTSASFTKLADVRRRMGDRAGLTQAAREFVARARNASRATVEAAAALERGGLIAEARGLVEETLTRRPTDRALLQVALRLALAARDDVGAEALVRRYVRLRGAGTASWLEAADLLTRAGRTEAALALLREAGDRVAADGELALARGRLELAVGDVEAAEATMLTALAASASSRDVAEAVDAAYRAAGQPGRLRRFHARAAALATSRSSSPLALGKLALEAGDVGEARQAFARYLGTHERGHREVAAAWAAAGYIDEAVKHDLRAWEQPAPGQDALPLEDVAEVLVEHGRTDALAVLTRLHVRHARTALTAAEAVAGAWAKAGRLEEAVAWYERASAIAARPRLDLARAELLLSLGRVEDAAEAFERSIDRRVEQQEPERRFTGRDRTRAVDEATGLVVERWLAHDRADEAIAQLRRSARLYGDGDVLALMEARLLTLRGDVPAALARIADVTAPLGPAAVRAVLELADALVGRDRPEAAVAVLEAVLDGSDEPRPGLLRIQLLGRIGRVADARRMATRLAALGDDALLVDVGRVAFGAGLYGLARDVLEAARHRAPPKRAAEALRLLEALDRREGRPAAATARRLASTRVLAEDRLEAAAARAELHAWRGDDGPALAAARQGLSLAPGDRDLRRLAILSAARLGDHAAVLGLAAASQAGERAWTEAVDEASRWLDHAAQPALALAVLDLALAAEGGHVSRRVQAVQLALRAGLDDRAREDTRALLDGSPGDPARVLELAAIWLAHRQPAAARALLGGFEAEAPGLQARRERLLAVLEARTGHPAEALAALERSVSAAPSDAVGRVEAADLALDEGLDAAAALALVTPAAERPEAAPGALAVAARAAWYAGRSDAARSWLDRWLRRFPARVAGLDGLLEAAIVAGDAEGVRALATAGAARVGSLDAGPALASLAASHLEAAAPTLAPERRDAVLTVVEGMVATAAEGRRAGSGPITSASATLHEVRGDVDAAIAVHERALLREPQDPAPANNLAYVLARHGRQLERALALVREASARAGEPVVSFLDTEGWILHRMGRSAEALPRLLRAVHLAGQRDELAPDSLVEMLFHLGDVQATTGRAAAARVTFRDCARRAPRTPYGARCAARLAPARAVMDRPTAR